MLRTIFMGLLFIATRLHAEAPVYVALWFDTEDYLEPAADDAALRIANDLTAAGVRATFKIVGEKARVLESRGRRDVVQALSKHDIGYHSNWHSVHPAPAEYLVHLGYLEGAGEFERREGPGVTDIKRVFGRQPACYGQPGNSWGPQTNLALRRLGVPVYLDEGQQVGLREQPFWYGGILYVFQMGQNQFRADLNTGVDDPVANQRFDQAAKRLSAAGGGVISIYYHPTEFVTSEFWDAVNFKHGANPDRSAWVRPHRRTAKDSERCFGVLKRFVEHMKANSNVRFVTATDLPRIYESPSVRASNRKAVAESLARGITFAKIQGQMLSPADMLLILLNLEPAVVDGPTTRGTTTYASASIPASAFGRTMADVADFVRRNHRLPNEAFVGADTLSLPDFAATLAGSVLDRGKEVRLRRGELQFESYFATDPHKPFDWIIHPEGFDGGHLLDLGRLQGWTLKPAVLVH
jgi:hypothetical protein